VDSESGIRLRPKHRRCDHFVMRYKLYTDERGYHIFRSSSAGASTRAEVLDVLAMMMLEDEERDHIPDRRAIVASKAVTATG